MWKVINFLQILFVALTTLFSALFGVVLLVPFFWNLPLSYYINSEIWSFLILTVCGVKLKVSGKEKILPKQGQIFASNHASHFDIPVLYKALPVPVYFIAKKEISKIPFMGWYMWLIGMIFIDRSNREKAMKSMRNAGRLINKGRSVISFPEGTRSKNGTIKLFKRGTFIIAKESGVPIVPVAITGAWDILAPGKFDIRPGEVMVKIGDPIDPKQHPEKNEIQLADFVRQEIMKLQNISLGERAKSANQITP